MSKRGILGGMFDLDGDGEMSTFESMVEYQFLHDVVSGDDDTDDYDDYDEFDEDYDDDL